MGITRINSKCITKCLQRGGLFCNMPRTQYGVCCPDLKSCGKYKSNFCSSDAPKNSQTLNYWSCPHTPRYCGKVLQVAGTKMATIKPKGAYQNWFRQGESCKFKIVFPKKAGKNDKIAIQVKQLTNSRLLTVDTARYKSRDFKEQELQQGEILTIEYPQ